MLSEQLQAMTRLVRLSAAFSCLLLLAAAPATQPARVPVPSQSAQSDALALIQRLFKEDYQRTASADQAVLSRTLIQEAKNTHDNPAGCYMLLTEARRLAVAAGDADLAAEAISLLVAQYDVQTGALWVESLPKILEKPRTAAQLRALANQAISAIDLLIAQDDFARVEPLAAAAESAATKVRQVDFAAKITARVADARETVREWQAAQQAAEHLKTSPDSAADHLVVGHFYALRLGRFDRGLRDLAAGSDAALARIARLDLAAPTDPMAQKAIADAWWDYAAGTRDSGQALTRARYWYAKARDSLTGLTLRDIDGRLSSPPATQSALSGVPMKSEASIDLLAVLGTSPKGVEGEWSLEKGVLVGSGKNARLQLPATAPAEYDVEMTFSREGRGGVALLLTGGEKPFNLMLDVSSTARLELVNKKTRTDNPTVTALDLENGKTYVVRAQIRRGAVYVLLDGKPLLTWRTDYRDLSRASQWKIPDSQCLGVGISSGTLRVEKLTLLPITGKPAATQSK